MGFSLSQDTLNAAHPRRQHSLMTTSTECPDFSISARICVQAVSVNGNYFALRIESQSSQT